MAGINFLGIKSGSSQSKAHRYLAAKRQSMQIPCREKARHTSILLRICKKIQGFEKPELPQRFVLSNPLRVFCVDTSANASV